MIQIVFSPTAAEDDQHGATSSSVGQTSTSTTLGEPYTPLERDSTLSGQGASSEKNKEKSTVSSQDSENEDAKKIGGGPVDDVPTSQEELRRKRLKYLEQQ